MIFIIYSSDKFSWRLDSYVLFITWKVQLPLLTGLNIMLKQKLYRPNNTQTTVDRANKLNNVKN